LGRSNNEERKREKRKVSQDGTVIYTMAMGKGGGQGPRAAGGGGQERARVVGKSGGQEQ